MTLRAEHHFFWRQNNADAAYSAPGTVLRPATSDETYIGAETDLLLNWQIDRHWSWYAGYSHFFAGDFIEETCTSGDIDFFYVSLHCIF